MNILWTKPTESGLADRLNDILFMATYARAYSGNVYINWPKFPAKDIDVAHRRTDILLENVLKFINFPKEVHFQHCSHVQKTFDHYIGGACSIEGFHHAYLKDICDYEKYFSIFKSVAADFTFCDLIKAHLANLPQKFVTFHIRRGDKVRLEKHDNTFINNHALNITGTFEQEIDHIVKSGKYNGTRGFRPEDPIEQHNLWCAEELRSTRAIRQNCHDGRLKFKGCRTVQ